MLTLTRSGTNEELEAGVTSKEKLLETPPRGDGFLTATLAVPLVDMSLAGIAAMSCVVLTNVVGRSAAFHATTEVGTKSEPFTMRLKDGSPPAAELGDISASMGTGFRTTRLRSRVFDLGGTSWSVTLTVSGNVPPLAGVPASTPALVRLIPPGRFPEATAHEGVPTSPTAPSVNGPEAWFAFPSGRVCVVTSRISTVKRRESSLSTFEVKVSTVTSKLKVPPTVGMPEILELSNCNPGGSCPPVMNQLAPKS